MTILYCTQKLRKELGVKDSELAPGVEAPFGVGNWYANLLRFGPKKAVLFVNEKTCYAVVALDVKRAEIRDLESLLLERLPLVMEAGRFSEEMIESVLAQHNAFRIAKSTDKKILGYLTDFGKHLRYDVDDFGGVTNIDEVKAAKSLNRMPLLSFDGATASNLFNILLTGRVRGKTNSYRQKIVDKYCKVSGYPETGPNEVHSEALIGKGRILH